MRSTGSGDPFDAIAGHRRPIELLRRMLREDRLHHGLIFEGPEQVGKATAARALAAALVCRAATPPCGDCDGCRMVAGGTHPDVWNVGLLPKGVTDPLAPPPESPDDARKLIVVDQIRKLRELAAFGPRLGPRRVFVIDPADAMNAASQNALLKTLEEPPGSAVLILVASRPHLLLPTVRSRSFRLGFSAVPTGELAGWLESRGHDPAEARARAALAEGRPGRALELDVERLREHRDRVLSALEGLSEHRWSVGSVPKIAKPLSGSDRELLDSLDLVEGLLRDAARCALGVADERLVHGDVAERLGRLGRRLGSRRAAGLVRAAERMRGDLRFNVNRTLIAEALLAGVAGGPLPPGEL